MQVEYNVKDSLQLYENKSIGYGLFLNKKIIKNTLIWKYERDVNVLEYNEMAARQELKRLDKIKRASAQHFLDITYGRGDKLCLIQDAGQYINHASRPRCNCITDATTGNVYALRDILAGEVLFDDYSSFDHPSFLIPLLAYYECLPTYYLLPMPKTTCELNCF